MKRPTPRQYGLDSDYAPMTPSGAFGIGVDPVQPFTEQERLEALETLIISAALNHRQKQYANALADYEYNNGGR